MNINNLKEQLGQKVTLGAWIANKRSSGKIAFFQLRYGAGFIQAIALKESLGEERYQQLRHLPQETSLKVTGLIKENERELSGIELEIEDFEVISEAIDYPITPKEHGVEFLADNRHIWIRSKKQHAILTIRNQIIKSTYDFFEKEGFLKTDPPILTSSAPEGTTELFNTKYFDEEAYLSQSGQLYLEATAMAFGKVFSFGPTFRAEKSKTRRHLIEFWMIEAEMAFCNHNESLALQEAFVNHLLTDVLEKCQEQLKVLGRDLEALENARGEFPRIKYKDAIKLLKENGFDDIEYGDDFGSPHETFIANSYNKPVFITHWPLDIKPFYGEEAMFLLQISYLTNQGEIPFSTEDFKDKLSLPEDQIFSKLENLINKDIIEVLPDSKINFIVFNNKDDYYTLRELLKLVERVTGKILTSKEMDIVSSWFDKKYTKKEIDEALTISKNLNYVNGILNNKVSNDIQKESGSSLGYDWFNK